MKQFSTDNSPVELELISGHLLFIDPLYIEDIIEEQSQIDLTFLSNPKEFILQIEEKIFPDSGGLLLGYKLISSHYGPYVLGPADLKKLKKPNTEQEILARQKQITTFGVDTASFLVFDLTNYEKMIQYIDYDSLIDALLGNQLEQYFEQINKNLGNKGWAYIVSEGINTNSEFDGDGLYFVA